MRSGEGFRVETIGAGDQAEVAALLASRWGSAAIVTRGRLHRAAELPGFVARRGGELMGAITLRRDGDELEIVSLDSLEPGRGVGTALVEAALARARADGCARVWLITTNDNCRALAFWQRRGFELVALHRGAIAESRRLKPEIPVVGQGGIPIRDELELERRLAE